MKIKLNKKQKATIRAMVKSGLYGRTKEQVVLEMINDKLRNLTGLRGSRVTL